MRGLAAALLAAAWGAAGAVDTQEQPLTTGAASATRGAHLLANRQRSLCVLCHALPLPTPAAQAAAGRPGNLGPDLAGVGRRLSAGQIRARLVDPKRLDPQSIMPAYYRSEGLHAVDTPWRGQPIFSAQQLEDVVAYLVTLQ
jgi:sulfur-oxidizing protein SoxX